MIKLLAAERIRAVEIEDTESAYPTRHGLNNLKWWYAVQKQAKIVETSDPDFTIGVVPKGKNFKVFLLHEEKPVAILNLDYHFQNLYKPASFALQEYRGHGLVLMLYRWVLDHGMSLLNEGTQSIHSHGLWKRLSRDYTLVAWNKNKTFTGPKALKVMAIPEYNIALLGKGQNLSQIKGLSYD